MAGHTIPPADRTRLAAAGARAVTLEALQRKGGREGVGDWLFRALLLLGLSIALVSLAAMLVWAVAEGAPRMSWDLFTKGPSAVDPTKAGYRTAILGSLWIIGGVVLVIVPIGIGAAVYLEEYADGARWWNRVIELNIQNLAGVPSIVFGILGLAFIVRGPIGVGFVAAAGSVTIALLVLPTVIIASREAIRAVPPSIREGSLALGATAWQTNWRQVLPAARPGILTGVILSVARAIGEAAPLLLVGAVTFVRYDPQLFSGGYSALPVLIYNYSRRPQAEYRDLAAAGIIVMLLMVLAMNAFAVWLRSRYEEQR